MGGTLMTTVRTGLSAAASLLVFVGSGAAQAAPLAGFDKYIESARAAWNVPALAIAVVKDDKVVYSKGFGSLEVGGSRPADQNTIFGIGSTTKAFTAAALAILVDEGKVRWDDRVVDYLPNFRLKDPYATANITIRDLLSHTSGLPAGDRMWYHRKFDRAEVVRRVRYLDPVASLRQRFIYSNTMYTAAGLVVEAVTGGTWDEFLRRRIFEPLGMSRTSTTVKGLERLDNVAAPYTSVDGKPAAIPRWNQDNIGPAGSINSTVNDLAQWLRLQLGDGTYQGRRLISAERVHEMHQVQTAIRGEGAGPEPPARFNAYGLGWFLRDYEGRQLASHGGGGHGVSAQVALVPEEKLGIVVLSDMDGNTLPTALFYQVIDAYLGRPNRDWAARFLAERDSGLARARREEEQLARTRAQGTKPSLPLDAYVGTYWHPYYDSATVWRKGDQLHFRFVTDMEGPLQHWQFDTFRALWQHPRYGKNFVTFMLGPDGAVRAVRVPAEWDRTVMVDLEKVSPPAGSGATR
jgi:CubicO group peptidase (beta-lactamase class C family)